MDVYPLFVPPQHLAEKGASNWNKKEALEYFDWFLKVKAERAMSFLQYIDYSLSGDDETDLIIISTRLYSLLNQPGFHALNESTSRKALNNYGLAVAADMGIFLSELLQRNKPGLYWKIGKGPKSYHSYNLPVLKQFTNGEWDLVFTSIQKNGFSLNELKAPYDWWGFYYSLKSKAL